MNDQDALTDPQQFYAVGCKLKEEGNLAAAFDHFTKAVELAPNIPGYRLNLALTASKISTTREEFAIAAVHNAQEACRIEPDNLQNWVVLGEVALEANKFPEATAAYEKAISIDPNHAFIWGLLGFAYGRSNKFDEAIDACAMAVKLDPDLGMPHFLLSCYYNEAVFNPTMIAYHGERGFKCKKPATLGLESMWNAAHGFLLTGDYTKGWDYFEARLRRNTTNLGQTLALDRFLGKPLWRGEKNVRVLVQTEMGLGDAFIMMRYLSLINKLYNCDVTFECHGHMIDLCKANFPLVNCVLYGQVDLETIDMQIPMMSLPLIFRTRINTVLNAPYIKAEGAKFQEWENKLDLHYADLNIGVCWFSGRNSYSADNHHTSKRKSLTFEQIKPLLDIPMVKFVSLQVDRDDQFKNPGIKTFSDTAAIIELLDVVITVDSAVANLAGAMGKEVWVMDRFDHCWRWSEIPTKWYPTAKIYRQPKPKEWESVVQRICSDVLAMRDKMAA